MALLCVDALCSSNIAAIDCRDDRVCLIDYGALGREEMQVGSNHNRVRYWCCIEPLQLSAADTCVLRQNSYVCLTVWVLVWGLRTPRPNGQAGQPYGGGYGCCGINFSPLDVLDQLEVIWDETTLVCGACQMLGPCSATASSTTQ